MVLLAAVIALASLEIIWWGVIVAGQVMRCIRHNLLVGHIIYRRSDIPASLLWLEPDVVTCVPHQQHVIGRRRYLADGFFYDNCHF